MSGELKLNAEEFYQAALAFIPVTEAQRTARSTASGDSNSYYGQWGNDEMGLAFYKNYRPLRSGALASANDFVDSFDQFREAFVDARDEFVSRDTANGELQARIGQEITPEGSETPMTVESGQRLVRRSGDLRDPGGDRGSQPMISQEEAAMMRRRTIPDG